MPSRKVKMPEPKETPPTHSKKKRKATVETKTRNKRAKFIVEKYIQESMPSLFEPDKSRDKTADQSTADSAEVIEGSTKVEEEEIGSASAQISEEIVITPEIGAYPAEDGMDSSEVIEDGTEEEQKAIESGTHIEPDEINQIESEDQPEAIEKRSEDKPEDIRLSGSEDESEEIKQSGSEESEEIKQSGSEEESEEIKQSGSEEESEEIKQSETENGSETGSSRPEKEPDVINRSETEGEPDDIKSGTKRESMIGDEDESEVTETTAEKKKKKKHSRSKLQATKTQLLSSDSDSSGDYVSTDEEKQIFTRKIALQEREIKELKRDRTVLQEKLTVLQEKLTAAEHQVQVLESENKRLFKVNLELAENVVKELQRVRKWKPSNVIADAKKPSNVTADAKKTSSVTADFKNKPPSVTPNVKKSSSVAADAKKPSSVTADAKKPSSVTAHANKKASSVTAYAKTPHRSDSKIHETAPPDGGVTLPDAEASWRSSGCDSNKRKLEKEGRSDSKDAFKGSKELSKMILDALKGSSDLQSDGLGKVHIGNGVWISEALFSEKISKPTVSPSIALRDATSFIYTPKKLAQRSLEGGVPVKGDKSQIKTRMTPSKREALLGVYRAKVQQTSGCSDDNFLDLAVEKKGKTVLRDKLKEAGAALKKKQGTPTP